MRKGHFSGERFINGLQKIIDLKNQDRSAMIIFLMIFIMLILPMSIIITQSLRIVDLNYQVENLEENLSEVQAENSQIERQIAEKKNLERIERLAREELNMVEAENTRDLALTPQTEESQVLAAGEADSTGIFEEFVQVFRRAAAASFD
ncbi:septum formation initiator family protein [Halarsenatibacter silvermanii]|uniref:Cell division protein FtsL n=1 Tax=Halarsenatibacter silvermanii TaxID=321763 RepID=A0A1G9JPU6_9FIRM|nr:septum formation initiator family protein [Halarsenatibacter silvermanii]SDL39023.1 cell division protein FtsL [Halarsenatibacter silvermanii]